MLLNELFSPKKLIEGGNVGSESPGWQGMPGDYQAQAINLKLHDRDFMVAQIKELLQAQNQSFQQVYGRPIWDPKLLASNKMFSGSSLHFFDIKSISTQDFLNKLKKTKVGDIDTQVDRQIGDEITAWLKSVIGKRVGNGIFVGFNSSLSSIWQLDDPPVNIQIDYELGPYNPETQEPTEWFSYSHSADYDDMAVGIKGVFHKYLNRALTGILSSTKYVARVLKKSVKISDQPVTDNDYSFAVKGPTGGGLAAKYKPYVDPQTGQPMEIDGIPVMQQLETKDKDYIQNLDKQFEILYGRKITAADQKLQKSFVGTIQLLNQTYGETPEVNERVARSFLEILFAPGEQMIEKNDPATDRDIKMAAVDAMLLGSKQDGIVPLIVPDAKTLRQKAVDMALAYEQDYQDVEAFRKANPQSKQPRADLMKQRAAQQSVTENRLFEQETKPNYTRQGIPHIYNRLPDGRVSTMEMKDAAFLELCQEIAVNGGNLDGIQVNVKIDGAGIRFGKDPSGRPFFMAGGVNQPIYGNDPEYTNWFETNSRGDKERARKYDMAVEIITNSNFIKILPADTIVQAEMLFNELATETQGYKTFVNIPYEDKKLGKVMTLTPIMVKQYSTGELLPDQNEIINSLIQQSDKNIKLISNSLQQQGINVGKIIEPIVNLDPTLKDALFKRGNSSEKDQAKQILDKARIALSNAIIESPKLKGLNMLGEFYEGIVINMPSGMLVKVTSPKMKQAMITKMENQYNKLDQSARIAVVTLGSFVGHLGHEQLINLTINQAKQLRNTDPNAKAFIFVGSRVGPDDPIPVDLKLQTLHKIFGPNSELLEIRPVQNQEDASTGVISHGTHFKKIEKELVKQRPFYNQIYVMVGSDYAPAIQAAAQEQDKDTGMQDQVNKLQSRLSQFSPTEHVKIELVITEREAEKGGTGVSTTQLRNALTQEAEGTITDQQAFAKWRQSFSSKLNDKDIKELMAAARENMQLPQPQTKQEKPEKMQPQPSQIDKEPAMPQPNQPSITPPQPTPVEPVKPIQERLLNSLINIPLKEEQVTEDWQKVNRRDKTDGMSRKAVKAYRRENPGSKLKTAVTTKPSKLKKGGKSAKRRKSFCARMSGMKKAHASAKTKRDPDSPINKALRRWNCESIEEMRDLLILAESLLAKKKESINEAMLPKSAFVGSKKNPLGVTGQWRNKGKWKNKSAQAGVMVGGDAAEESIIQGVAEGGFTSRLTQSTEVTPEIIRAAKNIIDSNLLPDFTSWLQSNGHIEQNAAVISGAVTGSGAHHDNDPAETVYGDIDMQIKVPDIFKGQMHTTGERQYKWKRLMLDFIKQTQPTYLNIEESIQGELPVVVLGKDMFVQVDLMPHPAKYSEWGQYRATAERGITGLLNGNLFSVLGELLSLNLQHSGAQFKTSKTDGMRQKFDSLKKGQYDLGEISANISTFVLDILKDEHRAFGQGQLQVDPLLTRNPGVKTVDDLEELRIQPLVNAIKGLARSFELNNLYGQGNLVDFTDSEDFLNKFKDLYATKAEYAMTNKKFAKAETEKLQAHVARKQEKIKKGLEYVLMLFDTEEQAPRFTDWAKTGSQSQDKQVNIGEHWEKQMTEIIQKLHG